MAIFISIVAVMVGFSCLFMLMSSDIREYMKSRAEIQQSRNKRSGKPQLAETLVAKDKDDR
jgi:uncharacterized membrane protein